MAHANVDIEWIVREVIRRLREGDAATDLDKIAATQRVAGELELSDRVVTLETLNKRLAGIQRVVVASRAIVTPAAVDELKDRGVALQRGGELANGNNGRVSPKRNGPVVAVAVENFDTAALAKLLGSEITLLNKSANDLEKALREITENIDQQCPIVLLTATPVTAVVTANRNPRVRAAIGFNFPAVRQAVNEAGANVLAIDPAGRTISELAGMIGEFLQRNK